MASSPPLLVFSPLMDGDAIRAASSGWYATEFQPCSTPFLCLTFLPGKYHGLGLITTFILLTPKSLTLVKFSCCVSDISF